MSRTLGQIIRETREEKLISLRQLADRLDISPTFLSNVERNLNASIPSEETICKIAAILELNFLELMRIAGRIPCDIQHYILNNPEIMQMLWFDQQKKQKDLI